MNFCKLPLRKNSARQTFVNTKILLLSILPIHCGFQHEYSTLCITLDGKKSNIYLLKSLGYKKYNVRKKISLTINVFLWKK